MKSPHLRLDMKHSDYLFQATDSERIFIQAHTRHSII